MSSSFVSDVSCFLLVRITRDVQNGLNHIFTISKSHKFTTGDTTFLHMDVEATSEFEAKKHRRLEPQCTMDTPDGVGDDSILARFFWGEKFVEKTLGFPAVLRCCYVMFLDVFAFFCQCGR